MATKTNTLLEVKNLSVDYYAANGAVHAVSDVSFTLERGKILGLAGESGCGKSTLAYAVGRLLRPPAVIADGSVIYHPQLPGGEETAQNQRKKTSSFTEPVDVLRLSPAELRAFRWNELSIVFQSAMNALNPVMTIGTQIIDVFQRHRPDMGPTTCKQRAVELLRLVGIAPDRLSSYPHELSGGMRQRAVIAIALALNAPLLIMDEPTTALDVVVQKDIMQQSGALKQKMSFSSLFITHDPPLMVEFSDRIGAAYA